MTRLSADARRGEEKERVVLAAFVGFQLGAAGKKTFEEYLKDLGLFEDAPKSVAPVYDRKVSDARLSRMGIKPKKGKH